MIIKKEDIRFEFGENWTKFIKNNFTQERLDNAQKHILHFLKRDDLKGLDFLDIGCGSGLHSLAAFNAGAKKIYSIDYDQNSVNATNISRSHAGNPENWQTDQGDVLDDVFIDNLGKWNFVYSWGVLHHTGEVWRAIDNAQRTVADDGLFYIALYAADVQTDMDFWLETKQKYCNSGSFKRWLMVWWYIWKFAMGKNIFKFPLVIKSVFEHRFKRGMNCFADIRDWLGGWPMEFTYDNDVINFLKKKNFELVNIATGEACSEFLFHKNSAGSKCVE